MTRCYFDSDVLVKLYVSEEWSAEAVDLVQEAGEPILFTHLHELEVTNALRLKAFREEVTGAELGRALAALSEDQAAGRLWRPHVEWPTVFLRAVRLSDEYAAGLGGRSLGILHVALAIELGRTQLVSMDDRQIAPARAAGMTVHDPRAAG